MDTMRIFYTPRCLEYESPFHPESPLRVGEIAAYLHERGFAFTDPRPCRDEDILRVHTPEMLQALESGSYSDADTPALPDILAYAKLSAGAAVQAAEAAPTDGFAFSLMRPPGHHATGNRIMGFCYLNNIAIAVSHFLETHPNTKAAILDIDCHHGNGTEDIFLGHPSVLFVSLHQAPLYPGTGHTSRDNIINRPRPPGTEEPVYLDTLKKACREIRDYRPSLIGVSAGFDTFLQDPLTQFALDTVTYRKIGEEIASLGVPAFAVLEGGYSPQLPECVYEFIRGFTP